MAHALLSQRLQPCPIRYEALTELSETTIHGASTMPQRPRHQPKVRQAAGRASIYNSPQAASNTPQSR